MKYYPDECPIQFSNWNTDENNQEPDLTKFDYQSRNESPITKDAVLHCNHENPELQYNCDIPNVQCSKTYPPNKYQIGVAGRTSQCLNNNCHIDDIIKHDEGKCDDGATCTPDLDNIFIDLDFIKSTTVESDPSCMGMKSKPVIDISTPGFDGCGYFFEGNFVDTKGTFTWETISCNQKTRSLICEVQHCELADCGRHGLQFE